MRICSPMGQFFLNLIPCANQAGAEKNLSKPEVSETPSAILKSFMAFLVTRFYQSVIQMIGGFQFRQAFKEF